MSAGPLAGTLVVEMGAIGPIPYCGMMLADMGAEVIRIDRLAASGLGIAVPPRFDVPSRGKRSIGLNLKKPGGRRAAERLIAEADILIEGFRPGVMERLGLNPERCLELNPRLVYGRVSGWGRKGPLAATAGHDLNFLALSGALGAMGARGAPPPVPLNLIGDYGGGAMHLACGVLAALVAARGPGGHGQVVETSILQGSTAMTGMLHGLAAAGQWRGEREANLLDGGAPFYGCYETADGRFMAVGALEAKFYGQLVEGLGLAGQVQLDAQLDRSTWPATAKMFAAAFLSKSRDEWNAIFADTDACVTPVLNMDEAHQDSQQRAVGGFMEVEGVRQPAPPILFSQQARQVPTPPPGMGADTVALLRRIGYDDDAMEALTNEGAITASHALT